MSVVEVLISAAALTLGLRVGQELYRFVSGEITVEQFAAGDLVDRTYRQAITAVGWPTYHVEDYVDQTQGMQAQLASLMSHGVFVEFPELRIVLIESGVSWLPAFAWRYSKFWRGLRMEVPWVDQTPFDILRRHVRLTTQPFDCPDDSDIVQRLMDHLGSNEMLLFSSDYPHWQFDGDDALPPGLPEPVSSRLLCDNPMETYPRLGGP